MEESRKKVLLIYDDEAVIEPLKRIFLNEYCTLEARSARDAKQMLDDNPELDLVIISYEGWDTLTDENWAAFREVGGMGGVPVIVVADNDDIDAQIKALDCGAEDVISKPFNTRMILHRVQNIIERRKSSEQAEKSRLYELRLKQQDEMRKLYEKDEKTGIYNRRAFCEHVRMLFRENSDKKYVIFQMDVDRFKVFNDLFGVAAGDRCLAAVGASFSKWDGVIDVYGHWDADDFVCCMEYDRFHPERVLAEAAKLITAQHDEFEFVVRLGIYVVDDPMLDVELMCDRAQLAMRTTKGSFGKQYAYYSDDMRRQLLEEQEIISEMSSALAGGQFVVYFQPKYNHEDGSLYGAEALVRWDHPVKGLISPGSFIPVFERNGFVSQLDEYVWDRTCAHIRSWLDAGIDVVPISVNISRCDIYNPNLSECLMGLINKYDIDVSLLRLEITETVYMESPEILIDTVNKLRKLGFFVEMDDFGSGYSSLNTLKDVPVDMLKLDLKFVERMSDERSGRILSSIIRMAHWLKLQVVAEGVETKTQADYLKSMGCLLMQGYYFAKPMPYDAFEILLRNTSRFVPESFGNDTDVKGAANFLDAGTQTTLLFNSFVGGAAIVEYDGKGVEALRINDKYFDVVGTTREVYGVEQMNILDRFGEPYRSRLLQMLYNAIETGNEAECEVSTKTTRSGDRPIWLRVRARYLYKNMDSFIFYLAVENTTEQIELLNDNRELSQRLSLVMASVPGGICSFVSDDTGIHMPFFNDNAAEMFGYSRDEFQAVFGDNPAICIYPEDLPEVMDKVIEILDSDTNVLRMRCRTVHKDGRYRWVQFNGHISHGSDGTVNASAIIMDIDEQVRNELLNKEQSIELERQRLFLKTLYDNIPCGIMRFCLDGKIRELVSCNDTAWKMFGFTSEEEFMATIRESRGDFTRIKNFYKEDLPVVMEKIQQVINTSERIDFDLRIVRNDGAVGWIRTILQKTSSADGMQIIQCVYTDINEQKASELQKYTHALLGAYDEIYEFDFEKNEGVLRSSKISSTERIGSSFALEAGLNAQVEAMVLPENQHQVKQFLDVAGEEFESKSVQFKFHWPMDDSVHWGEITLLHADGSAFLMCTRDITVLKNAQSLAQENELLRAAAQERRAEDERNRIVVDTLGVYIVDYDAREDRVLVHRKDVDGQIYDVVHEGYARNLEKDEDVAPEDRERFLEYITRACAQPMRGSVEFKAGFSKNGFRLYRLDYVSIGDENGEVYRVVGVLSDIQDETDRLEMLRRLSSSLGENDGLENDPDLFAASVFQLLNSSDDLDNTISSILGMIGSQFEASRAYIIEETEDGLAGSDAFEWHAPGVRPGHNMFQNLRYRKANGVYRDMFDKRGLLVAENVAEHFDEPIRSFILKWGAQSLVQCAIMDGERFVGYLGLDDCTGPRTWTREQLSLLSTVTSFIGAFLIRKRKTDYEMSGRAEAVKALEESGIIVYAVDENMTVLYGNARFKRSFGMPDGKLTCHEMMMHREDACKNCPISVYKTCGSGMPVELARGEERFVAQATQMLWDGERAYVVACVDITRSEAAAKSLAEADENGERFRILAEQTGTVIVDYNFKTGEAFRSDTYDRYLMSNMRLGDIPGSEEKINIIFPGDYDRLEALIKSAVTTGTGEQLLRLRLKDGGYSWTKVGIKVINDENGIRERLFCTLTDYDEQIDLQRELEAISDRANNIIANVPAGIAILEIGDWVKPVFVSDRACEMFGFSREEYDWRIALGQTVNYLPSISDLPLNTLECINTGEPIVIPKLWATRKNGGHFWLRLVCNAKMEPSGVCTCYTTLSDVSDIVEQEEKERWQSERYRLLSEAGNVVTFDYDPVKDMLELSYNDPGRGIISRTIEKHYAMMENNPNIAKECIEPYKDAIERVAVTPGEGIFDIKARLNGEAFRWFRANYVSVADSTGHVFRVVGRIDDINDMMIEQDEIRKKAMTDGLTGLLNKEEAHSSISYLLRKRPEDTSDAMMVLDIDEFKNINDTEGHIEGDRVLRKIGEILRHQFRSNDVVGRFGGDEFVVYMRAVGTCEVAVSKAASLVREIGEITMKNGRRVSCSIGLTFITGMGMPDFDQTFSQADYALYVSKNNGKNQFTLYDHETMGTEISSIGKWRET